MKMGAYVNKIENKAIQILERINKFGRQSGKQCKVNRPRSSSVIIDKRERTITDTKGLKEY